MKKRSHTQNNSPLTSIQATEKDLFAKKKNDLSNSDNKRIIIPAIP